MEERLKVGYCVAENEDITRESTCPLCGRKEGEGGALVAHQAYEGGEGGARMHGPRVLGRKEKVRCLGRWGKKRARLL